MIMGALRYILTFFPAIFFVKAPKVEIKYLFMYGLTVGVGQFGCLFYAIDMGMPAGIASVVLQAQAFFTIVFGVFFLREWVSASQIIGFSIASIGLYLVSYSNHIQQIPIFSFFLTLCGAAFWGMSNIIIRRASVSATSGGKPFEIFNLVIWSSLIPPIPFLCFSLVVDGPSKILHTLYSMNGISIFSILYLSFGSTLFGYSAWNGLLTKYPAGMVAPLSLLVPVTGLLTAFMVLDEGLSIIQCIGCLSVMLGLCVPVIWKKRS